MAVCPNCGEHNPERARLCMMCGTALDSGRAQTEERKVVSVLFVDLVGFTTRSHNADPEDVRAALAPYHRTVKTEIERFGGTVEKFIGDAVMALFGVPAAHEDDAERAVRAALRIVDAITALNEDISGPNLSIRAAVTTGEVLVNLAARPHSGESTVAGDVVNTAARLQQMAPLNGIVVGVTTYRSTRGAIDYQELDPVTVKGKPDPIAVWRAVSARGRVGIAVDTRYRTPFIGRELDLATLKTLFQRTLRETSLQLITIVGEPGVGKSRLLAEFSTYIDDLPQAIAWRQGRSLPYGDGITFWALGEIAKTHAGIKQSDSPEVAAAKLAASVAAVEDDDSDRAWLRSRLAPLVGVDTSGRADQEESFTAWLRFLDAIAATGPLILVFEDLHWADQSLVAFVEHLVEWSSSAPILIVCTARPELFDKYPTWATGTRNATTISLSPLSDTEIGQLISGLLDHAVLPADIHAAVLERAGGNPLYAEEFVRMLADRGILQPMGRTVALDTRADIPMPDSIQAIIAARLDGLTSERKSLLHNAAVVGRVFWSGAVAALSDLDAATVRRLLQDLVHTELVRPARTSSIDGQQEYYFWHALVRDVAYGQIPRLQRAARHQSAARWIEAIAGDRVSDHAEILAHHYEEATRLFTASSMAERAAVVAEKTITLLVLAGDKAIDLDVDRAWRHYEKAWRLLPPDDIKGPEILLKLGKAANYAGRLEKANAYFTQAFDLFRETGAVRGEADARLWLAGTAWDTGKGLERIRHQIARSITQLEELAPGHELVVAYAMTAEDALMVGELEKAGEWADKARTIAEEIGDFRWALAARMQKASARCQSGDLDAVNELREGYEESGSLGWGEEMAATCIELSYWLWLTKSPTTGLQMIEEGIKRSEERGLIGRSVHARASSLWMLFDIGHWDELLRIGQLTVQLSQQQNQGPAEVIALPQMAQTLAWRQQLDQASRLSEKALSMARRMETLPTLALCLIISGVIAHMQEDSEAAVDLVEELDRATIHSAPWRSRYLPAALRVLISAGEVEKAISFADGLEVAAARDRYCVLTGRAILAETQGLTEDARDFYAQAAEQWADYGFVLEEGQAHLGLARCLIVGGNGQAAVQPLHKARAIFSRLGAGRLIAEVDRHLGKATALSS
jgi:class 3 adenylate cyclase/tetratricopeptide (TPR) repeat protein